MNNQPASAIRKDVYLTAAEFACDLEICLEIREQEAPGIFICKYTPAHLQNAWLVRVHVTA